MAVVLPPPRPGPTRRTGGGEGRAPLVVGALVTLVAAVAFDVLAGEHPTHTLGLALVAVVVAVVRLRLGRRREGVLSVVSGAVVAQPALHAIAKIDIAKIDASAAVTAPEGPLHVIFADGPAAAMQIVVSVAVVIAVATSGRFAQLLLTALNKPVQLLVSGPPPAPPMSTSIRPRARRTGSRQLWWGWSSQAARRGPPVFSFS